MVNEEVRISETEENIQVGELNVAKGNFYPQINFFGNFNLKYPNYMFFPPDPYLYSLGQVGVELTYSLSNLYKNKTKVNSAKTRVELQRMQTEIVKDNVRDDLYKEHIQFQEIQEKFVVVDKALVLAKENYRIVRLKYLNQLVLSIDMVDADNALLQAEFNKISTRIDAVMKYYELLHTAGLLEEEGINSITNQN